jgi:hypothetical protein
MGLDHTIVQPEAGNDECTKQDKVKALHFLRHHLHSDLKCEYMTEKDPLVLIVPEGPLHPAADYCAPQTITRLDQPMLPRLQAVCGCIQLRLAQNCDQTTSM